MRGERWRIVGECGNMVAWDFGDGFGVGFLFVLIFQWIAGLVWLQKIEKIFRKQMFEKYPPIVFCVVKFIC